MKIFDLTQSRKGAKEERCKEKKGGFATDDADRTDNRELNSEKICGHPQNQRHPRRIEFSSAVVQQRRINVCPGNKAIMSLRGPKGRGNLPFCQRGDCFVAALLAMT